MWMCKNFAPKGGGGAEPIGDQFHTLFAAVPVHVTAADIAAIYNLNLEKIKTMLIEVCACLFYFHSMCMFSL